MLHIFTLWYGRKYSVEDVNQLYKPIKKWYKGDFKFYCYTDKPKAKFTRGIKVLELDRTIWPQFEGCWPKINMFKDNFAKYGEDDHVIIMDIDQEIVNDPTPLFDCDVSDNAILSLRKWWTFQTTCILDGGFYKFKANSQNHIYEKFWKDPAKWQEYYFKKGIVSIPYFGEQNFVSESAKKREQAPGYLAARYREDRQNQLNYLYYDVCPDKDYLRMGGLWSEHVVLIHKSRFIG